MEQLITKAAAFNHLLPTNSIASPICAVGNCVSINHYCQIVLFIFIYIFPNHLNRGIKDRALDKQRLLRWPYLLASDRAIPVLWQKL